MPDRTINWGDPNDAGTKYRTQDDDPAGGGNFVVAEDTDGNTVLLQWNPTASQWEYGGAVDLGGNDLTSVGTATVNALEADDSITDPSGYAHDKLTRTLGIPTPTAYFSGPTHGEGGVAFRGTTLAPDGRVVFAPYNSSNVGLFDPSDGSYTSGPAHGEGSGAFFGATLAPDGRVVFAPNNSLNVGIASQLLDFATASGANK